MAVLTHTTPRAPLSPLYYCHRDIASNVLQITLHWGGSIEVQNMRATIKYDFASMHSEGTIETGTTANVRLHTSPAFLSRRQRHSFSENRSNVALAPHVDCEPRRRCSLFEERCWRCDPKSPRHPTSDSSTNALGSSHVFALRVALPWLWSSKTEEDTSASIH